MAIPHDRYIDYVEFKFVGLISVCIEYRFDSSS